MIFGIGTDLVEIDRIARAVQRNGSFLDRYYTSKELRLIQERGRAARTAAMNFAGKEAVAKALGTGINGDVRLEQIEILRGETGAPYVVLYGSTKKYAEEQGVGKVHISLSDTDKMAVAYVIAEFGERM